ncbi:ADP-ribosylglycohydrolase family protein [Lentilactobacillus raoultii]|uniref:ADP-ribosylglycohydrolase family protein n=1 Tax=Lentilactobacillus raoultii TaxID=1987503 RepID=A0ABW3PIR5_9LACO|nr:ADP-ribosylglycohydrolase family protein [Lentilactobacillus raoultii]
MRNKDRVLGTLYGQAIGDAMGMPSELWPVEKIRQRFGEITTFLDGPTDNDVAKNFVKGEYTDDTNQALAILDALIENHWQPDQQLIANHLIAWAISVDAWQKNILGPSSKAALTAIKAGRDPRSITDQALTNGAGMRIAPVGALFEPDELPELVSLVAQVTKVTHSSDVAISGACLIAGAVTAGVVDQSWDEMMTFALQASDLGLKMGAPTWAAKVHARLELGLALAKRYRGHTAAFSKAIYDLIGTGTMVSESVPAAVAIAYFTRNVADCARLCANLGGDTDTIGAMACAICGAKTGIDELPLEWITLIDERNSQHDLKKYAEKMMRFQLSTRG